MAHRACLCKAFNFDCKFGEVSLSGVALKQPLPNSGASEIFLATHAAA